MGRAANGKDANPKEIQLMAECNAIIVKLSELLLQLRAEAKDEVEFTKMCVVALTNLAGLYAVDSGMSKNIFMQVAQLNFLNAETRAPRWN